MILTYHRVADIVSDNITVNINHFKKQMDALRLCNKQIVYLDEYVSNTNCVVIRFDDGFKDLITCAIPVLMSMKYKFEVFLVEQFVKWGNDENSDYLGINDVDAIIKSGGRLQYHSKTHPHLDEIHDRLVLEEEIRPPKYLTELDKTGFSWFAYPYWRYNKEVISVVSQYYKGALSGNGFEDGGGGGYALGSIRMSNDVVL
jgi:peptidoglycan/xylan/chitin deacetylase (PgdA/CDA1 family)